MDHIAKSLPSLKTNFPIDEHFRQVEDRRKYIGDLPVETVLWLVLFFFACMRAYSLLAMEQHQRSLTLRGKATLLSLLLPGDLEGRRLETLREKHGKGQAILSDSQIRRLVCDSNPSVLRRALQAMTMKARRDNTWHGKPKVVVYDGTKEGGSKENRCPFCKATTDAWYHLGVHLVQITDHPFFSMDYAPVKRGENELTAASRVARRQVKAARGPYADIVVADFFYASSAFIDFHRNRSMDVIVRGREKEKDKHPGNMKVFQDAANVFASRDGPHTEFLDSLRDRTVRIWDAEGFITWEQLEEPIRVLKMEVEDRKDGTTEVYWVLTTCSKKEYSAREIYEWTVRRWRIENHVFRQEKTEEWFTHRQVHDASGQGFTAFRILLLIAMNLVNWLGWRHLPSVSERLRETRYAFKHFRTDLLVAFALFLYLPRDLGELETYP